MRRLTFTVGTETEITAFKRLLFAFAMYVVSDIMFAVHINGLHFWSRLGISLTAAASESALALIDIFWLCFVEAHLGYRDLDNRKKRFILFLPAVIQIAMSVLSIFTHWLFTVDSMNIYGRGPFFYMMPAVEAFYMVYSTSLAIRSLRKAKDSTEKETANAMLLFIIAPFVATVFQVLVPNTPVVCVGMFISIYLVFVSLLAIQINHDALTKLNNRRRSEDYFAGKLSSATPENPIWLFLTDVNYFKQINDTYGHIEGDHALCLVADALRETADYYKGFAARIGGDEFVLSVNGPRLNHPKEVAEHLNQALKQCCRRDHASFDLTLSVGWARCTGANETMDELFRRADEMQYEDKKAAHDRINRK